MCTGWETELVPQPWTLDATWDGWIVMVAWAVCCLHSPRFVQGCLCLCGEGGWGVMERLLSWHREQSCALVSCGHLLPAAGMQRSPWCGVFSWLLSALLFHVGEPQPWHSSRQSIPFPLRVPPCPSGASQTNWLMSGPVFSNA